MTGGVYQPKRLSPIAVATVVLLHGAAITALLTARMDVMHQKYIITKLEPVPIPTPPPPKPAPQPKTQRPPDNSRPTAQPRTILPQPLPLPGPTLLQPPQPPTFPTGTFTLPEPPPPPPPPARTFEPARAHANLSSYVSDADYPDSALRSQEQGITRFRLSVGADGRVTGCTITGSSGSPALDAATCRLMKSRARFTPARDSNGNATADNVANAIHWILPEG